MSRIYSLPTFFRMVPRPMLKTFFKKHQIDTTEIPWESLKNREIEPLLYMFHDLPRETQIELEGIFQEVFELACESGFETLRQAAEVFNEQHWLNGFEKNASLYAISLWAWSTYNPMFQFALARHHAKQLTWWRKREGLPKLKPLWNEERKEALESSLQNYFVGKQNRGDVCTVETQTFDEKTCYFYAYPDDYLRHYQQHDTEGNLRPKRVKPTFEVVFAYNSEEGTLEIHAKGGEKMKSELEEIFLETVIGQDREMFAGSPYDLSVIIQNGFTLASDPEDCVVIQLKELRLKWNKWGSVQVRPDDNLELMDMLKNMTLGNDISLTNASIEYAKFQFLFYSDKEEKGRSLTFEIVAPNRCTLKNRDKKRMELIRKYLRKWRIENDTVIEKPLGIVPAG